MDIKLRTSVFKDFFPNFIAYLWISHLNLIYYHATTINSPFVYCVFVSLNVANQDANSTHEARFSQQM